VFSLVLLSLVFISLIVNLHYYKTFDVNSFLRKWQEFINIDTFFYCRPKFKTLDDVKEAGYTLIKFNDRVLVGT
jgi:hypothetical protein